MRGVSWIATGAALAALFVWTRAAAAIDPSTGLDEVPMGDESNAPDGAQGDDMPSDLDAFLYMLRSCEHTAADVASGECYQTFYGGARFVDLHDHPVVTGEMRGVTLPPSMCRAAGFPSGVCVSTAAGAYQITRPTWLRVRQAGAWGPYLPDFQEASQDEAARRLLLECGALAALDAGDVAGAIAKASHLWASLPGSTAGQGTRTMDFAIAKFNEGLG